MPNLKKYALAAPLIFILLSAMGCSVSRPPPATFKFVVVFVDVSASVVDTAPNDAAWELITKSLKPGDQVVLGVISDSTLTTFQPICNVDIKYTTDFEESELWRKKRIETVFKEQIRGAMRKAQEAPRSKNTEIMSSLIVAQKIFGSDPRRRILVILSDMLEDSPGYKFDTEDPPPRKIIQEQSQKGLLPNLGGAKIYVAGASAKSTKKAMTVQKFWLEYLAAANCSAASERYGPALLRFDE